MRREVFSILYDYTYHRNGNLYLINLYYFKLLTDIEPYTLHNSLPTQHHFLCLAYHHFPFTTLKNVSLTDYLTCHDSLYYKTY